jgi:hypothetical protein
LFHRGNDTRLPLRSLRTSNGSRGQGGDGPRGCGWQRGSAWWWVQWSGCGGRRAIACSAMHVLVMGCLCVMQTADSSPGTTSPTIDHRPQPQPQPPRYIRNHFLLHAYARRQRPGPVPSLSHPAAGRAVAGGCLVSEAQNRHSPLSRRPCFNRCFTVTEAHMRRPLRGAPTAGRQQACTGAAPLSRRRSQLDALPA